MKTSSKNSKTKEEKDNNETNNSQLMQNMQNKIKDQAKRLMSMQEYINTLESTLRENQTENSSKKINKEQISQNDHIKQENEFYKQNLETNIIKNDLKDCLNFLKEKMLQKEKEGKIGNDSYVEILEEIMKIKNDNKKLLEEKKIMEEKIEEYENNIGDLRQNMDLINKLNNENNNLYNQNVILENQLNEIKNIYEENQKELNELKQQNYLLIKDNEVLHNMNNNIYGLKQENEELIKELNNLQFKLNEVINENNSLRDYKLGYDLVVKENNEIKDINNYLSNDNMLFAQDVYILKNNLDKLTQGGNNNDKIRAEIEELRNTLNNLKNRKNINNIFEHISELEKQNKFLEEQLYGKDGTKNKKEYLFNNDSNKNINTKISYKNKDNKYISANKFYSEILLRILKYHIKEDDNIKNILFQLLDLNHKKISLTNEIENLLTNNKIKDTTKKRNEINKKKKELEKIQNKLDYYDQELKKYE